MQRWCRRARECPHRWHERFTGAVPGSHIPAGMTGARSVAGVYFNDFDNSFFRFCRIQLNTPNPRRGCSG